MHLQTSLDVFHAVSAEIERETSTNFAWYRIRLYGEDSNEVCTLTVFPSTQPDPNLVPLPEEFFKFVHTKEDPAQLFVASPAPAAPSTSESNSEL